MVRQTLNRTANYVGLASNALRARLTTSEQVRRKAEKHLVQRMGKLRGLPQKLGQMLSFRDAVESGEDNNAFQTLQEDAEPLPFAELAPLLEQSWGKPLHEVLTDIDPIGKAGSIGQVHRATLHDGRQVAVKVRYPGIEQAVQTDLKMLGWLSRPVGNLRRGFDMSGYRQAILDDLELELDYREEAKSYELFQEIFSSPAVKVPCVVTELSCDQVLVTDWLEGDHWDTVRSDWTANEKQSLTRLLLSSFLEGLFLGGAMQADWHPGNFRFRRVHGQVEIVCYDLGSIYRPDDNDRLALARLIQATREGTESPFALFLTLGFSEEFLAPMADKLPALCSVLFEPFCVDYPYNLDDWKLKQRVADILGEDRWNFRIAGPPPLVFLMRAFHGLTYYLRGLGVETFWSQPFEEVVQQLLPQMRRLELRTPRTNSSDFGSLAKHLRIRVTQNGKLKATVTTSAKAIENLDEILEEDVKRKIAQRDIALEEVVSQARRRCYAPGKIFELEENSKRILVALE